MLDETLSLRYLTEIWGKRPDVAAVSSDEARALLAAGDRPLYVTNSAAPLVWQEINPVAHLSSAGQTLIRVRQRAGHDATGRRPAADLPAGDGLSLLGIDAPQPQ